MATASQAQIDNPGWIGMPEPTSSAPSFDIVLDQNQYQAEALFGPPSPTNVPSMPIAEFVTPEIQALADGLQDDPVQIFDYVHDHIKFALYAGSKKGAELTLLEKSGNDFDQCALLVALLSAAGYTNVQYECGWQVIPYDDPYFNNYDLHHWWQLSLNNTNWSTTINYLNSLAYHRGIAFYRDDSPAAALDGYYTNNVEIQRTWVALTIGSNTYQLDPAFKISMPVTNSFSLTSAMGGSNLAISNLLLSASGGTDTGNYCQSLNEAAVRNQLTAYATNLLGGISSNNLNLDLKQMLGGWQIVPAYNPWDFYDTYPKFAYYNYGAFSVQTWTYVPTNLMATLRIQFANTNYSWLMPQLQGQRLALTFDNSGVAQLWQDDNLLAQGVTSGSGTTNVTLSVHNIWAVWDSTNLVYYNGNSADQSVAYPYQCTNGINALPYSYEPDWGWLQQRENKLNSYLQQGLTNGSRQVTSETLNIMGMSWMIQDTAVENLLAAQLGILQQSIHCLGRMSQEAGNGYQLDLYMHFEGAYPNGANPSANVLLGGDFMELSTVFASALEHGVIEQFQSTNNSATSTVKMLQVANTNGQPVCLANSTNWTSGYNVRNTLTNYTAAMLTQFDNLISSNYTILLPMNGSNRVSTVPGSWAGCGYEALQWVSGQLIIVQAIITGNYHGGQAPLSGATTDPVVIQTTENNQPNANTQTPVFTPSTVSADPVDTADATFEVEHTDLSVGQAEPRGISFARYYNGTRKFQNTPGLPGGWVHNYAVTANQTAAPQAGLGGANPAQAASMLAATAAAIAVYNHGYPDPKNWLTTALIAKWGIDQIIKNGVSVSLGKDSLQFVRQPDGTFTPPANCTAMLLQSNVTYSLQLRHGNSFNFDALGRLNTIVDPYGNPLTVTYVNSTSSLPQTVTDWKNRSLVFTYTSNQLTSVSDGSRTVSYGYSTAYNPQGDLTSFTDAEGKTCTYVYDTNHQITATLDAQSRLVVSNSYNTQGRITTQYTQGDTNKMWRLYWSGWKTTEFDPANGETDYHYDDQGRLTAVVDPLNHETDSYYDGQNHVVMTVSPLGETNQFIYDSSNNVVQTIDGLGYTNRYYYDANNNLIATIDPRGNTNSFGYNAQFSMTGQTNGAGDWVNYAYNGNGTLYSRADAGTTNLYGYDAYGQLSSITYPGSLGTETFASSVLGDVTNHTDGRSFSTGFSFNSRRELTNSVGPTNLYLRRIAMDSVGNAVSSTDARGNLSSNVWSATRHLLATVLPTTPQGASVVTNIYDARDWLVKSLDPYQQPTLYTNDAAGHLISQTDPVLRTSRFAYDADGRKLLAINAANETNRQTWDARGGLLAATDGANHTSRRVYDAAGNQIILTNRNGNKWQFQFDGANRLTNTITPLGRSTSVVYNHQGLPTLTIDPASQVTTNTYDAKSRLVTRGDKVGITSNLYDANNNVTSVVENGQTNSWAYDAYNRVSSYKDIYGNLIQYRYDAAGNVTNLVYPGGHTVAYYYDSLNRLTNVVDWSQRKTAITYDLDSRVKSITRPNGSSRTISYDPAGQATNILEQMSNSLPIALFVFNWTNTGTMGWEFAAPLPHTASVPTRTMAYDADNRLTNVNSVTVTSDLDGNLTYAPLTNGTLTSYSYDARNRLLTAGGVTNAYDALNNRIRQTVGTNSTVYVVNPTSKLPQVLMRIKNGVTNYYVYGAGLLYQVTETATGTNTLTYHYDYRGSTIALSADNGNVTDRIEYSAYGLTTYRIGASDTPFLFNGRYGVQSDSNGLLYMRSRYYNPYLCRFINPDPSGFGGGLNFYAYANGNPVSYLDPFGLNATATGDSYFSWYNTSENTPPNLVGTINPNVNTGSFLTPQGYDGSLPKPSFDPSLPSTMYWQSPGDVAFQQNLAGVVQVGGVAVSLGVLLVTDGASAGELGALEGIANPVPASLARVIPGEGPFLTLGQPGSADVFVTDASAIRGMTPAQISQTLGIPASDTYSVIEFPTPSQGLASPVFRSNPGFIGGGITSGGAPEFVIPNGPIPAGATTTIIRSP